MYRKEEWLEKKIPINTEIKGKGKREKGDKNEKKKKLKREKKERRKAMLIEEWRERGIKWYSVLAKLWMNVCTYTTQHVWFHIQ
jgi:hypothetical protein